MKNDQETTEQVGIDKRLDAIEEQLRENNTLVLISLDKPLRVPLAARYLEVSESYVHKLHGGGELRAYQPHGKLLYFEKRTLDEWIRRRESSPLDKAAKK